MQLKISRIFHAGYLFEYEGTTIAFDPLFENPFSKNCYVFPEVELDTSPLPELKLDAIFISHYHDDHFSLTSLNLLDRQIPIYIFSLFEELLDLIRALGFTKVYPIEILRPISIGPLEVRPLEALDSDVDSLYHIKVAGLNILHVVDSWIGPATMKILSRTKTWDLILWPMQTMREIEVIAPSTAEPITPQTQELPPEWIEQLQQLNPLAVVPSSCQFRFEEWSWYNHAFFPISYTQFTKQIQSALPNVKVHTVHPGESLEYHAANFYRGARLPWIKPCGDQNVDYKFNPPSLPPSIAEISRHLSSLNEDQRQHVHTFCIKTLYERFSQLATFEESWFSTPQSWLLALYDQQGGARHYHYQIHGNKMTQAPDHSSWTWMTEIAECKLFAALYEGESLTSIYVRVTPPPQADPLEDPLIRCLYEGVIGGYQKAQLEKIRT
ncbi:MAG: MBL fold metallo-hydrolase [Bdellovibrio sp.]